MKNIEQKRSAKASSFVVTGELIASNTKRAASCEYRVFNFRQIDIKTVT
jgi:hypothetical protein